MAEEGEKNDVDVIEPDKEGKHPETVTWGQYVRTKETIGGKLDTERQKVQGLEEKLKSATNPEEFNRVKEELETTKTKLTETTEELTTSKETTLTEKRGILIKRGIPEDSVKDMTVKELNAALVVLEHSKPGADLGGGGGAGPLETLNPMESANRAYAK